MNWDHGADLRDQFCRPALDFAGGLQHFPACAQAFQTKGMAAAKQAEVKNFSAAIAAQFAGQALFSIGLRRSFADTARARAG